MEKKKLQKLNKAAVATVLAASGITVTAPVVPTKAATIFKDLDPNADYYKPVMELYNRGYISGFQDGTFRPHQAITRGESAKMLALALNLNITNPKNPGFRDIPATHEHYKYIAALANEGIINGYSDKTFRPNELINRNQMAKIIALGYEFQLSNKLTHDFTDVSESNANRFYIQTLYDLGITKGTTGITFSPHGLVTRGQLSTFILRAENTSAEKVKPIKEIGHVEGSYVYINGIKYRVDSALRDIINDTNAAALKGAHIDGQIVGETLKTIATLTLNAQGTSNRILTFDGNDSTFSGQLIVQGSYIHFKNWTLTGPVTIAEKPRRTLSDFANPWQNRRVASLTGFGFIDWEKPTDTTEEDDDPTYNGGGNDLTEKPSINPGDKVVERMPIIENYVDFSNCSLRRLVIEANRTYVASTNKLPHVNVRGWVRQFEMYAHIDTLYIETDVATTMYGVGDIGTIYKNSYKDVYFNSDSHVNLMVVDNSSGWIDLGDHFYVDKVIIPPNKLPNDIFNDFVNDNDNIGDLEDSNGEDVDREPDDDIIVPDLEAPTAEIVKIDVQGSSMTGTIKSSEDGYYYYTIRKADERIPTIREIMEEAQTTTLKTSGTGWIDADINKTITASGLEDNQEYVLYLVTKDEADNYSDKVSKSFSTKDGTLPIINVLEAEVINNKTNVEFKVKASELGNAYYVIRKYTNDTETPPPTAEEVFKSGDHLKIDTLDEILFRKREFDPYTTYKIYMVMEDLTRNRTEVVKEAVFTTGEIDYERPYLLNEVLDQNKDVENWNGEEGRTQVTLRFNEPLDPKSATNINNYKLSGTGNLTGRPYEAKLANGGRDVILTVPSMAAFVNNDTLIIEINGIMDESGNEIQAGTKATLTYKVVGSKPVIDIKEVKPSKPAAGDNDYRDVTFTASAPGRYYYLVLPVEDGLEQPLVEDVIFPDKYLDRNKSIIKYSIRGDKQGENVINEPGENLIDDIAVEISKAGNHKFGYKIYLVMQDRNGNYSEVEEAMFYEDKTAPSVLNFAFVGTVESATKVLKDDEILATPDTTKFFFEVDEYGMYVQGKKYFQFRVRFDEPMDESSAQTVANYVLSDTASGKLKVVKATLLEDKQTVALTIEALPAPGESNYLEYNLIHDEKLTIKLNNVKDASKLNSVNSGNGFSFGYDDRVKPKLKSNVAVNVKQSKDTTVDDKANSDWTDDVYSLIDSEITLEVTFTEAIKASSLGNYNFTVTDKSGAAVSIASVQLKPSDSRVVQIKLAAKDYSDEEELLVDFNSTTKITDVANNAVSVSDIKHHRALYIYRALPTSFYGVGLNNPSKVQSGSIYKYKSQVLDVDLSLRYTYDDIRIYYAIANTTLTDPDMIINAQNYSYSDIYGNMPAQGIGTQLQFKLTGDKTFQEGQRIFIVVQDQYGNQSVIRNAVIPTPITP
ncbi:S-layer homology domain-containing protein [Lysinibacillus sp. KU-BSD001]|uniref:S-layer homology domain-containing protein n=1 Tax=Lysinibacillus sp. KU-BSD001 TaxID=3141328 RepID=UPI0036E246E5